MSVVNFELLAPIMDFVAYLVAVFSMCFLIANSKGDCACCAESGERLMSYSN